jgi:hypothetical protein
MVSADLSIEECLHRIEQCVGENRNYLEPVITELHSLLNKWDRRVSDGPRPAYKLVREGFDPDRVLKQIRELAERPNLKIPQIRFKADQLSKAKRIPLPNSTRKHKEPLLQWYEMNWELVADDIQGWKDQNIPNVDG